MRDLARSGRLARLRVTLQDRPGALYRVMGEFEAHNVNIIEIYHQRMRTVARNIGEHRLQTCAHPYVTDLMCPAHHDRRLRARDDRLGRPARRILRKRRL